MTDTLIINKIVTKFPSHLQNDLFQECYIELQNIKERYNPDKGSLQTFSYRRLNGHCIDFINSLQLTNTSLNDPIYYDEGQYYEPIDLIEDDISLDTHTDISHLLELVKGSISINDYKLLTLRYIDEYSLRQIIDIWGVHNGIKSRKTLKKYIDNLTYSLRTDFTD